MLYCKKYARLINLLIRIYTARSQISVVLNHVMSCKFLCFLFLQTATIFKSEITSVCVQGKMVFQDIGSYGNGIEISND